MEILAILSYNIDSHMWWVHNTLVPSRHRCLVCDSCTVGQMGHVHCLIWLSPIPIRKEGVWAPIFRKKPQVSNFRHATPLEEALIGEIGDEIKLQKQMGLNLGPLVIDECCLVERREGGQAVWVTMRSLHSPTYFERTPIGIRPNSN